MAATAVMVMVSMSMEVVMVEDTAHSGVEEGVVLVDGE